MELDEFLKYVGENDELGLLKVKAKSSAPTADEHLLAKFNELNDFVALHHREPEADMANVPEFMLYQRLKAIRANSQQCEQLSAFDIHGLLNAVSALDSNQSENSEQKKETHQSKELNSIEDILDDDNLGLLDEGAESIFQLRNVPNTINMPSKIARRERCENFEEFEDLFKACHSDLANGERVQQKFTGEQQIQKGHFFILHGVMCYVADMKERTRKNGKVNAKLHLIFENGTESDMLLRSLATELYKDETGRRILSKSDDALYGMLGINDEDKASGYIYILQSLSTNPEIQSIKNLYKIGYSTFPVEKRIANASREPTYLMAPVHHISTYQCFNMNTQKFEDLLHTFFGKACLDVEVVGPSGETHRPREWFIAPLKDIEMAIQLLINGEIINYRFDLALNKIVER